MNEPFLVIARPRAENEEFGREIFLTEMTILPLCVPIPYLGQGTTSNITKEKQTMKRYLSIVILLVLGFSFLLAATTVSAQEETSLQDVKDARKIIIGTEATYAPFESVDPETSEIVGFDADIAHIIGSELGVSIEWKDVGFDTLIPSLSQGNFDMVIAAMTITDEREEQVDFSRWYYKSEQAILMLKTSDIEVSNIDDLNNTDYKIGVQEGTTSDEYMKSSSVAQRLSYDSITLAIQALKQGSVDAVLGDHAVLVNAIASSTDSEIVGTFSPENFGIAVKSGSTSLLNEINSILNDLLGSDVNDPNPNDLYNTVFFTWFDLNAVGYTGTVTDAEIPRAEGSSEPTPGFEFITALATVAVIPVIRRIQKK